MNADLVLQTSDLFGGPGAAEAFLVGRVVFGLVVAFAGPNRFPNTDHVAGYAEAKDLPMARASVFLSGGLLLFGGLGVVGAYPTVAAGGIALFVLVSAVVFHDSRAPRTTGPRPG